MPMQSKVNDVLMEILISRFMRNVMDHPEKEGTAEEFEGRMKAVGSRMGLVLKIEQFHRFEGVSTVRDALAIRPFLFVGYYFWRSEDQFVYPFIDLPRTMAQMAYPSGKWTASNKMFLRTEAMRLTSIAMGSGIAPPQLRTAQMALFQECERLLVAAIGSVDNPDEPDERLVWATQVAPLAMSGDTIALFAASLKGLQRAFEGGAGVLKLWRHEHDFVSRRTRTIKQVYTAEEILALRPLMGVQQRADGTVRTEPPLPGYSEHVWADYPLVYHDPELRRATTLFEWAAIRGEARRELSDLVEQEAEAPVRPERRTYGRFPRLKRETPREESARKHRQNVARARLRKLAEAAEDAPEGPARPRRGPRNDGLGSVAAARSLLDAGVEKDSRRKRGSGRRRK